MQGIHAGQGATLHRYADHRQGGERRHHARQMSGAPGAGNDHPEALTPGLLGKVHHFQGRAVRREHPHLHIHTQLPQDGRTGLHGGQIGIAAHHHRHARKHCRH